ncbi:SRPBCC family protein [Georgenia halophila]|uniref:SRPBCC family protein n=1 Tax=Georgenia halophila TaxID=620889 RepID=A0ABP8L0T0_9MICO
MSTTPTSRSVRHEIVVDVPVETAFRVFTEQFDKIKPREHNLLASPIVETVFETFVGGSVYDRAEDGSVCRWGRVLVLDPPHRLVFSWDITPEWQVETDPERTSEVELQFLPDGDARTLVALEHRHLDRHGPGWESERSNVDADGGWPLYLQRFAAAAGA